MDPGKRKKGGLKVISGQNAQDPMAELGRKLRQVAQLMDNAHVFQVGQLVKWKPGLKHVNGPGYDALLVIREVLTTPGFDPDETSPDRVRFREPLTIKVGFIDWDGDFLEVWFDGRRFEPADLSS